MKSGIFDHDDYREYLKNWLKSQPHKGRGVRGQIAKHLNISSVSVSYVFNGQRELSEEQAVELTEFLGLSESESEFFLVLVQRARAGTHKLKKQFDKRLDRLRVEAQNLKSRVPAHREMDESAKAQFYSSWYYSATRLLTSMDSMDSVDALADFLKLPRSKIREVTEFLIQSGLCRLDEDKIRMGPQRTHVAANSLLVARHHTNWRLKAIENMDHVGPEELFFTGPMTLSAKTLSEIRGLLAELIAQSTRLIEPSEPEMLACMNLDLFKVKK